MEETSGLSFPFKIENGRTNISNATYADIAKIKESVYQILTISAGERVNEPQVGSIGLRLVFKNENEIEDMLDYIQKALETNETRISNVKVSIQSFEDGQVALRVVYTVFGQQVNQYLKIAS